MRACLQRLVPGNNLVYLIKSIHYTYHPFPIAQEDNVSDIGSRGYANPDVLVSTEWVAEHLNDPNVRIVESDEDILLYDIGHIPGAVKLDWHIDLQDQVRRDFIDKADFEALVSRVGIGNHTTVIFYGDRNNWYATYAFWLFKYYGHKDCRVMNGGRAKWESEGRPYERATPSYPVATYLAKEPDQSIRAFRDDVMAHLPRVDRGDAALVDVRSPQEYSGEVIHMIGYPQEGAQRGGHIAGARNVPGPRQNPGRAGRTRSRGRAASFRKLRACRGSPRHRSSHCRLKSNNSQRRRS